MPYLRNCWYMAGWADELGTAPLSRTLLEERVVMYRDSTGTAHALKDACPHRLVPLSRGRIVGDAIECAYHGLRFASDGRCVHNPQGEPPKGVRVRTYPFVERHGILWIWMGDGEADAALITDYRCNDLDRNYLAGSYLFIECDYRFGADNIMDLSHIQFIHRNTLARRLAGCQDESGSVRQDGDTIWSDRDYRNTPNQLSPEAEARGEVPTFRHVWIDVRWNAPSNMLLMSGGAAQGQPRHDPASSHHSHIFTPATATTCHYWFGVARPKDGWTQEAVAAELEVLRGPFSDEDHPMLVAQQEAFGATDFWDAHPVILAGDAAAVRARRLLDKKIRAEAAGPAATARRELAALD